MELFLIFLSGIDRYRVAVEIFSMNLPLSCHVGCTFFLYQFHSMDGHYILSAAACHGKLYVHKAYLVLLFLIYKNI